MTNRDADSGAQTEPKRLRFDRYILDLRRGCLLLDGREIALRPKTFAVLHCLAENSGRLVAKDELFAAVWPNLAITDDALVQSIGELRRALGDDGPRLIRTVPRRGYRLDAAVGVVAPPDPSPTVGTPGSPAPDGETRSPAMTIRDHALALLKTALTDWRGASVAALALVALLAAGTLWTIRGTVRSGDQSTKSAELDTKAAIAILPFVNQGNDPARDYFADGVTQDIINALGRFSALTVMSWNAVLPYKAKSTSPGEIGRSLAVRYQVEGSVR
ncbi:MAG: winged helix-turn-helix domain-containing protein, partial [Hyphomicrobiaceae bacterium]